MTSPTAVDPFAGSGESVPALSFKGADIGLTYEGVITSPPELVQGNDFESGEKAVWKNTDGSTSPKMSVVLKMSVNGEEKSLWAVKPSAMFQAVKDAQTTAGKNIEVGGTLAVRYTGDKPNAKNPKLNAAKQYLVKYTPPSAPDAFGGGSDSPPW